MIDRTLAKINRLTDCDCLSLKLIGFVYITIPQALLVAAQTDACQSIVSRFAVGFKPFMSQNIRS